MESGPVGVGADGEPELDDVTSLGTFTLHERRLDFFGMSVARLAAAVALIDRRLGSVAGRPRRCVRSIRTSSSRGEASPAPRQLAPHLAPAEELLGTTSDRSCPTHAFDSSHTGVWIDDPDKAFGGIAPREAAAQNAYRDELERTLRSFEHHSAGERDDARPGLEVAWLRAELGLSQARLVA
jgi:hypothetical protein